MQQTYKISEEGLVKLKKEHKTLSTTKRQKAVDRLTAARAMGDLSENSEYTASREDLNMIDARIAEIEHIIENVEILNVVKDDSVVQIGDTVKVKVRDGHEEFAIVGELEADITANKISDTSPIGKALLGSKVGSRVSVEIPAGEVLYEIVKIKK
jgi:transcription elongation factor GreA